MSQFNAPVRRTSGSLDVYTGLLFVATVMLVVGVAFMAMKNMDHSTHAGQEGHPFKLVTGR